MIKKIILKNNNVYFNENQYFANIIDVFWNFYFDASQPARKQLVNCKGAQMDFDDIKIISNNQSKFKEIVQRCKKKMNLNIFSELIS